MLCGVLCQRGPAQRLLRYNDYGSDVMLLGFYVALAEFGDVNRMGRIRVQEGGREMRFKVEF